MLGCDSVLTLHLTVGNEVYDDTTAIVCGSFDWYEHTGIMESGDYTHTFANGSVLGCDSVLTLHLTIGNEVYDDTTAIVCGSFDWYEHTGITESGEYTHVFANGSVLGSHLRQLLCNQYPGKPWVLH